jgi:hypothetical protein
MADGLRASRRRHGTTNFHFYSDYRDSPRFGGRFDCRYFGVRHVMPYRRMQVTHFDSRFLQAASYSDHFHHGESSGYCGAGRLLFHFVPSYSVYYCRVETAILR